MRFFATTVVTLALGCGGVAVSAEPSAATPEVPVTATGGALTPVDRARESTLAYADELQARLDGFVPQAPCRASASGVEGVLYLRRDRADAAPVAERPAGLLYVPQADGRLRLGALVYLVTVQVGGVPYAGLAAPENTGPVPQLFGELFDGPSTWGDSEGVWRYRLTAWLHVDNPSGTFARYNPAERCP